MATKRVKRTKEIKPVVEEVKEIKPVVEEVKEIKPVWKVLHGGISLLGQKQSYAKGDTFEAQEWEIPNAFRDLVTCITPILELKKYKKAEPKYFIREVVPTADELDDPDFVQKYDIIDAKDKVISDGLTKDEANDYLEKLN